MRSRESQSTKQTLLSGSEKARSSSNETNQQQNKVLLWRLMQRQRAPTGRFVEERVFGLRARAKKRLKRKRMRRDSPLRRGSASAWFKASRDDSGWCTYMEHALRRRRSVSECTNTYFVEDEVCDCGNVTLAHSGIRVAACGMQTQALQLELANPSIEKI
jgi:hypothetical protein